MKTKLTCLARWLAAAMWPRRFRPAAGEHPSGPSAGPSPTTGPAPAPASEAAPSPPAAVATLASPRVWRVVGVLRVAWGLAYRIRVTAVLAEARDYADQLAALGFAVDVQLLDAADAAERERLLAEADPQIWSTRGETLYGLRPLVSPKPIGRG